MHRRNTGAEGLPWTQTVWNCFGCNLHFTSLITIQLRYWSTPGVDSSA